MKAGPDRTIPAVDDFDAAADQAIAACGGDARKTREGPMVANEFLEVQLNELRSKVSTGYARGRLPGPRERNDEADG
ncbi:hypothetical protein IVB38_38460 [Bradyrhizobium sp. 38]|uniref:hypothetical protein n=1 Tax=unclassified Bradyrhizobium TaxID=2631580 RepID=UPI001FF7FF06|nr:MULTISPECIES: hypothetical protein [unclassified Bradyrhizobium]MCK1341703.1 hypothetical protein [Bradyrhizobium sp. 38]MCK1777150.1 hypothetical protein [Bradyrhizobium sp. 132]